jgi:hypothetical protein
LDQFVSALRCGSHRDVEQEKARPDAPTRPRSESRQRTALVGVRLLEAEQERAVLPKAERAALINADAKLGAYGPQLGYPHTSAVRDADRLRELRPRAGRSAWRALYRQVGEVFVVAAVGPEAQSDPRGFERAVRRAVLRLADLEED